MFLNFSPCKQKPPVNTWIQTPSTQRVKKQDSRHEESFDLISQRLSALISQCQSQPSSNNHSQQTQPRPQPQLMTNSEPSQTKHQWNIFWIWQSTRESQKKDH